MNETELRATYLKDLSRKPRITTELLKAARRPSRTLVLPFSVVKDDPFLLYATWGLARLERVTIILPPGNRRRSTPFQTDPDMAK